MKISKENGNSATQVIFECEFLGTDSNVFITIFGSRGDSGKHKLAYSKQHINKFERNYLDTFDFKFSDLGDLKKVVIEHDDWGQGSAWYLERVEVVDVIRKTVDLFPCEKWLDKTKGDRQVCRELYSRQRKPLTQSWHFFVFFSYIFVIMEELRNFEIKYKFKLDKFQLPLRQLWMHDSFASHLHHFLLEITALNRVSPQLWLLNSSTRNPIEGLNQLTSTDVNIYLTDIGKK